METIERDPIGQRPATSLNASADELVITARAWRASEQPTPLGRSVHSLLEGRRQLTEISTACCRILDGIAQDAAVVFTL